MYSLRRKPHNELGRAKRAKEILANPPRGSAGLSRGRVPWLVGGVDTGRAAELGNVALHQRLHDDRRERVRPARRIELGAHASNHAGPVTPRIGCVGDALQCERPLADRSGPVRTAKAG